MNIIKCERNECLEGVRKCTSKISGKLFPLPWWTNIVGCTLAFIVVVLSTYFIVGFGGGLGEYLATQWLIAMIVGLFKSAAIIQPIKVLILLS